MSKRTFAAVGSFFEVFGSAVVVSRAIEAGRQPRARDLKTLGIDPENFAKIGR